MSNIKIGDRLVCDNGHTYTLGKGNGFYKFALLDECNNIINLYHDYAIKDCMPWYEEDQRLLHIYNGEYTRVLELIEV